MPDSMKKKKRTWSLRTFQRVTVGVLGHKRSKTRMLRHYDLLDPLILAQSKNFGISLQKVHLMTDG
jgi:hypothetical protein